VDSSSPLALTRSFLNEDYPLHRHDFYELVTIEGGSGIHRYGGTEAPLSPGTVFVIKPNDDHGFYETKNLRLTNIIMYGRDMLNLLRDLKSMAGFQCLFVMDRGSHRLSAAELVKASSLLEEMYREHSSRRPAYQARLKSLFLELAVLIMRSYDNREHISDDPSARLGQALAYMERDFYREITIPEIAQRANISPRQFQRTFSRLYGVSPIQYLLNLRVQAACSHLSNTDAPIGEIGELCGFGDSNYFSRQFRRATGLSPREYRRKNGGNQSPGKEERP